MRRKFLTTCTIKGTRGGNLQADVPQYGRSMIEMLGVLAIIGVLSVGGIVGYTKARRMYNSNLQRQQIREVLLGLVEVRPTFNANSIPNIRLAESLAALGYMPQGLTLAGVGDYTYYSDEFGNKLISYWTTDKLLTLEIELNSDQKLTTEAEDYCVNSFVIAKEYATYLKNFQIHQTADNEQGQASMSILFQCTSRPAEYLRNFTMPKIYKICHTCVNKYNCRIHFNLKP
jgi:hypothetical protein